MTAPPSRAARADVTLLSGSSPPWDEADLVALLDRLEGENPDLAAVALDSEIDSLLDRAPRPSTDPGSPDGRTTSRARLRKRGGVSAFEWFQPLVARHPVLSREDTERRAAEVEAGLLAEEYLATHAIAELQRRQVADFRELARIGRASYEILVLSNLRLAFYWSKGIASQVDSDWAQDAFQAGCIGLIRGVQGWDFTKGFTLSTYVSWHIRQSIQRWRNNEILLIRIPVHIWESLDNDPDRLTSGVREAAERSQNIWSLDEMDGEEAWFEYDSGLEEADERLERHWLASDLLSRLDDRSARILRLRHGFDGQDPMTLNEIGEVFEVTRERIRQIESKALKALRLVSQREGLVA